MQIAHIYI